MDLVIAGSFQARWACFSGDLPSVFWVENQSGATVSHTIAEISFIVEPAASL